MVNLKNKKPADSIEEEKYKKIVEEEFSQLTEKNQNTKDPLKEKGGGRNNITMINTTQVVFLSIGLAVILFSIALILSKPDQVSQQQNVDSIESNRTQNTSSQIIPIQPFIAPNSRVRTCHPSYSGCLEAYAGDYDCEGKNENGPNYTGKVQVLGPDVFYLDKDKNGWACDE